MKISSEIYISDLVQQGRSDCRQKGHVPSTEHDLFVFSTPR